MDTTTMTIVVSCHVVDLMDISLGIILLNCWGWRRKLNENGVDFSLIFPEKITGVSLESRIFEVSAHFDDVCDSQCRQIMSTPLVPPFLILQSLTDLALIVSF